VKIWTGWKSHPVGSDGGETTSRVGGKETSQWLGAEHPTFRVPEPTLIFRMIGDAVDIDDVQVSAIIS